MFDMTIVSFQNIKLIWMF